MNAKPAFEICAGDPHPLKLGEGIAKHWRWAFRREGSFVVQLTSAGALQVSVRDPKKLTDDQKGEITAAVTIVRERLAETAKQ